MPRAQVYNLYTGEVEVSGLPSESFETLEYDSHGSVKLRHQWVWRTRAEIEASLKAARATATSKR